MSAHSESPNPVDLARSAAGALLRLNAAAWRIVPGPGRTVAGALELLAGLITPEREVDALLEEEPRRTQAAPAPPPPARDEPPATPVLTEAERRRAHRVPVKESDVGRADAARLRTQQREREDAAEDAVVRAGPRRDPGPEIRIAEPWEGYDAMRAADIVARLRECAPAVAGLVELYERQHGRRATVLTAAEKAQRRNGDRTA
jgi:hypothetical protein